MEGTTSLSWNRGNPQHRATTKSPIRAAINVDTAYRYAHLRAVAVEAAKTNAPSRRKAVKPASSCVYFRNCSIAANVLEQIIMICLPKRSARATAASIGVVADAGSTADRMQIASRVRMQPHPTVTTRALPTYRCTRLRSLATYLTTSLSVPKEANGDNASMSAVHATNVPNSFGPSTRAAMTK